MNDKAKNCRPWALLIAGCLLGAGPRWAAAEPVTEAVLLAPGAIEERCVELRRNQLLDFGFNADAGLAFNLHYHAERQIRFPINIEDSREYASDYVAPEARRMCLMWTNKRASEVELEYRYQALK